MNSFITNKLISIKWYIQSKILRFSKKKIDSVEPLVNIGKCVILAAHSDDETIGCYNLLNKNSNNCTVIYFGLLGGNQCNNNKEIRYNEIKNAVEKLNCEFIELNKSWDLFSLLYKINPDSIFAPSIIDWHKEHRLVLDSLYNCITTNNDFFNDKDIYLYQETVPLAENMITSYISFTKASLKKKWNFIKNSYQSQSNLPWYRFYLNDYINGKLTGSYASEVYSMCDINKFCRLYISSGERIKYIQKTRKYLNNIYRLRYLSNEIYNNIVKYEKQI